MERYHITYQKFTKKGTSLREARGMEMKAMAARKKTLRESILIPNHLAVTR